MSESKKKRQKRRLPFPSGIKGYYCLDYYKNRNVRVVLYDEHGSPIPNSDTRYTRKNGESEQDGFKFALAKAVDKVEAQREAMVGHKAGKSYFSDMWNELTRSQKAQCANGLSTDDPDKISAIKYFERNVLPKLDRCGKGITHAQLLEIRDKLLQETLGRVNYTQFEVKQEDVKETPVFFQLLTEKLRTRNAKKSEIQTLADVEKRVRKDARLQTLLERYLQKVGASVGVERFLELEADEAKADRVVRVLTENKNAVVCILDNLRLLSGNVPVAKRTVNGHVLDSNRILRGLALYQSEPLPDILIPFFEDALCYQEEKWKTLPQNVRLVFARMMVENAADSNYAAAALVMLTDGTRTEETCSLRFGGVLDLEHYGVYTVTSTNRRGTIVQGGKNSYFARPLILMRFVLMSIRARREKLRKMGYTDEEIDGFYIACDQDDVTKPIHPNDFSRAVRNALSECGCTREFFDDAEREQRLFYPEMNVVAYLLRREAISLMCNYDGMNPQLVDAMVGHATAGSKDRLADLKNEDKWPVIASEMERNVYIPEMTENLAYHPVTVETNWSSKLVTQESAVRVKKGERYQVVYEVGRGTEYVNARLPTTSKAVFESAEASSQNPVPIVLPLIGEGASRCANAATDLASDTGQNKTKEIKSNDQE